MLSSCQAKQLQRTLLLLRYTTSSNISDSLLGKAIKLQGTQATDPFTQLLSQVNQVCDSHQREIDLQQAKQCLRIVHCLQTAAVSTPAGSH